MIKKENKKMLIVAAMVVVVVAAVIVAIFSSGSGKSKDLSGLDLGNKYLDEMDYDKALAAFESVLDIDPKNVEAYLGIVEVYIRQKDYDKALEIAKEGYEKTGDERLNEKISMIQSGNIKTSDNRMMKRTCYDPSGQILWYHDFTYKKGTKDHVIEAFSGDGAKINQAEVVYGESVKIRLRDYSYGSDDGILHQRVSEYENGLKVRETEYESDGVTVYAVMTYDYNDAGQRIREARSGSDGNEDITEYVYNSEGQTVRYDTYHNGQWVGKSIFTYYENGYGKGQEMYDAAGNLNRYTENIYDEDWNRIGSKTFDGDGNLLHETKDN